MHFQIPVFLLFLSVHTLHAKIDYCKEDVGCETPEKNTLCKYSEQSPCDKCEVTMDDTNRETILKLHNQYRADIANGKIDGFKSASNMNQLSYDYELERFGQRLAIHQCNVEDHDECRRTTRYHSVGQNIRWEGSSKATPEVTKKGFAVWISELKDLNPSQIAKYVGSQGGPAVADVSQILWAETHLVGCGQASYYGKLFGEPDIYAHTMVCNYAKGGLVFEDPVYKEGPPCSNCPSGATCSKDYPGLCKIPLSEEDKQFSTKDYDSNDNDLGGTLLSPGVCFLLLPSLIMTFHEFS